VIHSTGFTISLSIRRFFSIDRTRPRGQDAAARTSVARAASTAITIVSNPGLEHEEMRADGLCAARRGRHARRANGQRIGDTGLAKSASLPPFLM
jgi:hypothetical protein